MYARTFAALALACAAWAQAPAFEVASVKLSEPITPELVNSGRLHIGVNIDSKSVRISQFSLYDLTTLAYQVKPHQLSGPSWMPTVRYDIQAKLPEGATRGQVPAMLQTLLAERFGLKIHRETREFRVYGLVVAKGGARVTPSAPDDEAPSPPGGPLRGGVAVGAGGAMAHVSPDGNQRITPGAAGNLHVENKKMTMAGLASAVARYCDLPVVDMTEIKGTYDLEFDVSGDEVRSAARAHGAVIRTPAEGEASDPSGVSLSSSLQKLGLKLEPRKAPFEVIIVDHVEKVPTQN
jgi:uncharacterized protein (TIGR03435 family)